MLISPWERPGIPRVNAGCSSMLPNSKQSEQSPVHPSRQLHVLSASKATKKEARGIERWINRRQHGFTADALLVGCFIQKASDYLQHPSTARAPLWAARQCRCAA
eukprot:scaffold180612_cov19-Tisochrysis_lutea.AAC.1